MKRFLIALLWLAVFPALHAEPSRILFSDDFSSGDLRKQQGGVSWAKATNTSVVTNRESPSGKALRFRFGGKPSGEDSWAEQRLWLPHLTDVYIEVVAKIPLNYAHRDDTGSDNNKIVRVWNGDDADDNDGYSKYFLKGGFSTVPSGDGGSNLIVEWGRKSEGVGPNNTPRVPQFIGKEDLGKVRKLTYHFRTDLIGPVGGKMAPKGGTGALEAWKDDKPLVSYTTLSWRSADGKGERFSAAYLFGWANSGFAQTTEIDVYRVTVYVGKPPTLQ
jgi:hypothetical protein